MSLRCRKVQSCPSVIVSHIWINTIFDQTFDLRKISFSRCNEMSQGEYEEQYKAYGMLQEADL
jgi:hypothetical protein